MSLIRLLRREPDGEIVFREPTSGDDIQVGADMSKTVSKTAAADGLGYFWVDTCCIDKKNAVELGAAINSMFRWYQNAARCYVYLSDISKPDTGADDQRAWEEAFRRKLIAPRLADFFSSQGERLGSKLSLESKIHEITGIANKALRGDALSNFSIKKRRSWAERRNTTIEEDEVYCLTGIFDVSMVPNYGERRDQAFRRWRKRSTGWVDFEQFAVGLNLASFPEATQFVAREKELSKMHELLQGHSSRSCVILHGLGDKDLVQVVSVVKAWLDSAERKSDHGSIVITTRSSQVRQGRSSDLSNMSGRKGIEKITFDRIQQQNTASQTTQAMAYFDRQDMWFDLLRHANSVDDEWIQKLTKDELNFNEAITLLCTFGLVDPDRSPQQQVGARGYSVHSCVHSWIVFVLNKEWDKSLARLALTCVASEVPDTNEKHWWLSQRRLLQHATRQAFFIVDAKVDVNGLHWGFHNLGDLYFDQGKLAEAEAMYLRALEGKEKALGPDHTSTLDTVNNLGILYSDQGKLAEAEAMYLRALEGKEKALGPDHTSTLSTVHNLGTLYKGQGKLAEAEAMYFRALEGKEKALGPDHTSTLDTVHNLGTLYSDQGKLAEAEAMYLRALEGKEKALGPDHTSTLDTVHNLGTLYSDQGKLAEAEAMYLRALEGKEKALGPDHTSTLSTVNNLGTLYSDQGKLAEAEAMYLRALEGYEDALGLELASSYLPALNTMFAFGDLFSQTDRKDMARTMYNRALSGYTTVQGPSSKWSRQVEDRLQALQVASAESNVGQNEITEPGVANSMSLKQKIRQLGRRLNIR
ncbi:hypothetical protein B0O99DRAFT_665525 [Bisporella sp. PMI_857]|nr:hypothetical protein B0O99DRAFT_665525 [Bisporella sp. PMI_857]